MPKALGIITAASNRYKVEGLQEHRPIGGFSFAGRYRVIDFPVSNMSNSDIDHILVYINGNPRSLVEHLGSGRIYNINSKRGKLQLLFHDEANTNEMYNTDIASFLDNIATIERSRNEYVVIAPSNMVFRQNFDKLLRQHIDSGADITLLYHRVDNARTCYLGCNILSLNRQKGVQSIDTNMGNVDGRNIFMDTYIMKKSLLLELIFKARNISSMYHLSRIVSLACDELDIRGVQHKGYFAAITDLKSYYDANLSLINRENAESLFDPKWPFYTRTTDSCPTQYFEGASVHNSLIANACSIEGTVENSVIGRGVTIKPGCSVKDSVILAYSTLGEDVHLENQVVDKWATITHAKELRAASEKPGYIRRDDIL
ncbi:MAG: glucose-1-phosphate adenylyltransferase subunit GlgD [Lachnospiraceae bacterium]|nr:glucose-1-phosphate adenylyltransferase subunit GlgD [Lachnospiraceae bacterium]